MTGNTVLPMTFMFLGNRDDFHIAIKAPFLKYILMDKRFGINEEKPGIYEISVQEEEKLQKVLVDVQHEIRDKMNKEEPDSEVFRHLKPTDEIIIEMPGDFRPLTLTDAPGTSEGGPMGQWMRDAAAYQKNKAHLELHMVDAGSSGVEMYIRKTEETTEEAQVSNEKGQKLLLVNKVKDEEHIEEIKQKLQNSKQDHKNVMYTRGISLLARQLLQTEKELLGPLSESELENQHSAEKQKLLYRGAVGDFQNHKAFVKKWDRERKFVEGDIIEKCLACDNFALLSFLETAASQHRAKCSVRLLEEAAMHYDKMTATYSTKLNFRKGKFDKLIEELEKFLRLDHQKQMEDLKETKKYKKMKRQLEDGIEILHKGTTEWQSELLRNRWYQSCVDDLKANAEITTLPKTDWSLHCQNSVCKMMVSKLFDEEEEETFSSEVWDPFVAVGRLMIASSTADVSITGRAFSFSVRVQRAVILLIGVASIALVFSPVPFLGPILLSGTGFPLKGLRAYNRGEWGKEDLSNEAIEQKILEASLKVFKENAPEIIAKCRKLKAEPLATTDLELKEACWKMKAAALRKFAKQTFGPAQNEIP